MAKSKAPVPVRDPLPALDAPGVLTPTPSMDGERAHMWQRAAPPMVVDPEHPYPHALPRFLHKDGAAVRVDTPEACEAALDAGWVIHPGDPVRA